MKIRRYSELVSIKDYDERFEYLKLDGSVGESTFGFDRYMNQALYSSDQWKKVRRSVILRDNGCDMGDENHPIGRYVVIHHMNPITSEQIENRDPSIFDPEYLICVSDRTHKAIHYGDSSLLIKLPKERTPNDTCPWR